MLDANRPPLSQAEFDEVLRDHAYLIELANELEFRLYDLGEHDPPDPHKVIVCQQAAGVLIRQLRAVLFRFDQQVYPLLDPSKSAE